MAIINIGILAHVDAGKTSLTERLLYGAGVIDRLGSVNDGNTYTDNMEMERQRGITIRSAVASFDINGVKVNLIDTPGHPDFIAEVERALVALDAVVLVVSAVEGIQSQTKVLFRMLQRFQIPVILFVNKIDRTGAQCDTLLKDITLQLSPASVCMSEVQHLGTPLAKVSSRVLACPSFSLELAEKMADDDEKAMLAFVNGKWSIGDEQIQELVASLVRKSKLYPVYFGSAILGEGTSDLMAGIARYLPPAEGDPDDKLSATIFKIERGPKGEKRSYVRVFDGSLQRRHQYQTGEDRFEKVTGIEVFSSGGLRQARFLMPGQIGVLTGIRDAGIGDYVGEGQRKQIRRMLPPTLETLVSPRVASERGALLAALVDLSDQDPLIQFRQDDLRQQVFVSLYGEVQKEVIRDTLLQDYGLHVDFLKTAVICIERIVGTGEAAEFLRASSNPFLATIGLRVEPLPLNSGNEFKLEVELGSIPLSFHKAVEEAVAECFKQGIHGWDIQDCRVTMTRSGYLARQSHSYSAFDKSMSSTARDFRQLTPLVFMDALKKAKSLVCEPINGFKLELPKGLIGVMFPFLSRHRASPRSPLILSEMAVIEGTIPAANIHDLRTMLPYLTGGTASFESSFDHNNPVEGLPPERPRTDNNPLDRATYLIAMGKRL